MGIRGYSTAWLKSISSMEELRNVSSNILFQCELSAGMSCTETLHVQDKIIKDNQLLSISDPFLELFYANDDIWLAERRLISLDDLIGCFKYEPDDAEKN
jgi:hypothetical protein